MWNGLVFQWCLYIRNRTLPDTKFSLSCPNIFVILPSNIALDQSQGCALAVSGDSNELLLLSDQKIFDFLHINHMLCTVTLDFTGSEVCALWKHSLESVRKKSSVVVNHSWVQTVHCILGFHNDVTKIQTKKLLILLSFYFHEVLPHLNTFVYTNCQESSYVG